MDKGIKDEEQLRATVLSLRDELNLKNGMRAAELQVALPRIKVLGEDDLELDPPKPPRSSTTDVGDGFMQWTAMKSATVDQKACLQKVKPVGSKKHLHPLLLVSMQKLKLKFTRKSKIMTLVKKQQRKT